jgi:DNA-binding CsgD family transcriptional regulator
VEVQLCSAAVVGFTPLERAGLALLLGEHRFHVSWVADDLDTIDAIDAAPVDLSVVLIDLAPYRCDTSRSLHTLTERVDAIRARRPLARIVGISERRSGLQELVDRCGIDALVDADARPEFLMAVVTGASQARRSWSRPMISALPLSGREREVLALIATGQTSRAVAGALGISVHTVESHKQRVFRRLGVQNQAQAVAVALRLGLLDGTEGVNGAAS